MAEVWKVKGRKSIAESQPSASVSNWGQDNGLRFIIQVGEFKMKLSHYERDNIIEAWSRLQMDFES